MHLKMPGLARIGNNGGGGRMKLFYTKNLTKYSFHRNLVVVLEIMTMKMHFPMQYGWWSGSEGTNNNHSDLLIKSERDMLSQHLQFF